MHLGYTLESIPKMVKSKLSLQTHKVRMKLRSYGWCTWRRISHLAYEEKAGSIHEYCGDASCVVSEAGGLYSSTRDALRKWKEEEIKQCRIDSLRDLQWPPECLFRCELCRSNWRERSKIKRDIFHVIIRNVQELAGFKFNPARTIDGTTCMLSKC